MTVVLTRSIITSKDIRWLFHTTFCLYFVRVFVWHVSSESASRPTRQLFGGYFRYLTMCAFTVQVLQLTLATLADLSPYGKKLKVKQLADDLSCSVFSLANTVTLLFYTIEYLIPGGILIKSLGAPRPWINISVHLLNSFVAWTDIIISHPRRFSRRSFWIVLYFAVTYGIWISFIKYKTGKYPYGFLNLFPNPYGLICMIPIAALVLSLFFFLGRELSKRTTTILASGKQEDLDRLDTLNGRFKDKTLSDADEINALKLD